MTRFASVATGPRIAYRDSGRGVPLVLGHGFMLDSDLFDEPSALLADRFRVVTWDARGHGRTAHDGGPFTLWDSARDLIALLDALGIDQAVVGGHSQGGFVAMSAALLAPERVAGLVLIDTTPAGQDGSSLGELTAFGDAWQAAGPTPELCQVLGAMVFGDGDVEPWIEKWMKRHPAEFADPFRAVMERDDLSPRLSEITAPALVVHGSADSAVPVAEARQWASHLPGADPVVVIDGAPHASPATHPREVASAIARFLSERSPAL
ncbi:alpha/beta fold hydrolase [Pseudonocardia sp. CA-107938]|uniref:alpha/beta fold hydrolase n=1 Tax=Pseudonocardia sp. CA-107938 TaxID=3240021 RepID=UPI003D8D525E